MEASPTGSVEGAASRRLPFRFQNSESSDATKETPLKDKEGKMLEYCFVTKKKKKKDLFTNKGYILMVKVGWFCLEKQREHANPTQDEPQTGCELVTPLAARRLEPRAAPKSTVTRLLTPRQTFHPPFGLFLAGMRKNFTMSASNAKVPMLI